MFRLLGPMWAFMRARARRLLRKPVSSESDSSKRAAERASEPTLAIEESARRATVASLCKGKYMSRSKCRSYQRERQKTKKSGGQSGHPISFAPRVAQEEVLIKAQITPAALVSVSEDNSVGVDDQEKQRARPFLRLIHLSPPYILTMIELSSSFTTSWTTKCLA